jgi:hypothetical protein
MDPNRLAQIQAERTAALHQLRTTDPVAWCIAIQPRGLPAIAETLAFTTAEVEAELERLLKSKTIKRKKYMRGFVYHPESQEMTRLARRARTIRYKNRKLEELGEEINPDWPED